MWVPVLRATFALVAVFVLAVPGQLRSRGSWSNHTETLGHDGYEKLTGHAYGEVDPELPLDAIITDLEFARATPAGWWSTWRRLPSSNRLTWRTPAVSCSTSSRTAAESI